MYLNKDYLFIPSVRLGLYAAFKTFKPKDRIILSPINCREVLNSITKAKLVPVFIDINRTTGTLRTDRLRETIKKTSAKAVLTTNLYGCPDNLLVINEICEETNTMLVEDCAMALGSKINGKYAGSFGEITLFSFEKFYGVRGAVIISENLEDIKREIEKNLLPEPRFYFKPKVPRMLKAVRNKFGKLKEKKSDIFYRKLKKTEIKRIKNVLEDLDTMRNDKIKKAKRLIKNSPWEYRQPDYKVEPCYFRVPLFPEDRDKEKRKLESKGHTIKYIEPVLTELNVGINLVKNKKTMYEWNKEVLPLNPTEDWR